MYTAKDIEYRSIYVINCINNRTLRVSNGELLLEEETKEGEKMKTLTKMPFQKILALFIVGHIKITTPLIEKCQKFGVALIVVKQTFRPVFYWANSAEANYLLRQRQYAFNKGDTSIAKVIVKNKLENQHKILTNTRCKDELTHCAQITIEKCLLNLQTTNDYAQIMGLEGTAAKAFFESYYQGNAWHQRRPRTKCDALNATLDIGYTILFNFIECYLRMFGFDLYVGVYHRLWFKRKSLVCDIMEPFRGIIDKTVRTAWNRKQFSEDDFVVIKDEWRLKYEKNSDYCKIFFDALVPYKIEVFKYIQSYYRCFMGSKSITSYPEFKI